VDFIEQERRRRDEADKTTLTLFHSSRGRYVDYYNNDRTHRALGEDAPNHRLVETEGEIVSRAVLGGLHHRYSRSVKG